MLLPFIFVIFRSPDSKEGDHQEIDIPICTNNVGLSSGEASMVPKGEKLSKQLAYDLGWDSV